MRSFPSVSPAARLREARRGPLLALGVLLAGCAADPCADVTGEPTLELGGASSTGAFEPFEPGAARELVLGPQGGMHVFLHARVRGLCPTTTALERRVLDDASAEPYLVGRGPVDFVETETPGVFELTQPIVMILCPEPLGRPVAGHRLRFVATADDDADRSAAAELAFVASCPAGVDCESVCAP